MKTIALYLVFFISLLLIHCRQSIEPVSPGTYHYTSYDSSGTVIVKGWFTMDLSDSSNISGEWHFKAISNSKNIGPQIGNGNLVGRVHDRQIWIELNPKFKDNNLQLVGKLFDDGISGRWLWISFIGVTSSGTFEAVKN